MRIGRHSIPGAAAIAALLLLVSSLPVLADAAPGKLVTLAESVQQALAAGPDIRLSAQTVASAEAAHAAAAARNAVGLSGSASANRNNGSGTGRFGSDPSDVVQAGLSLSAPLATSVDLSASHQIVEASAFPQSTNLSLNARSTLWDGYPGGSGLASLKQAELTLQGTRLTEAANRASIISKVKQSYYTLLAQQRQIGILEQTLAKRQEELKKSQALYDAASATQIDLMQARINQRQAELDLRSAQGSLEIAREQLSALVGWPIADNYTVAEVDDLPVPDMDVATAVATALAERSEMKRSALSLSAGEISVALAKAKASPTVGASAGITYSHDWSASVDADVASFTLGLSVQMPIMDSGAVDAQVKQASLGNDGALIQKEQLAASIATEVKRAIYSLRDLLDRATLAQSSLELAQRQYDLTRMQFESGVSSNLDVLGASVALTTAQASQAKARSDAQLGVLALQNAIGN
jgi:outer membrane protein TolC